MANSSAVIVTVMMVVMMVAFEGLRGRGERHR